MKLSRSVAGVRPFVCDDIPAVAALHWRVFGGGAFAPELQAEYAAYFRDVYLENPSRIESVESLVCEEDGKITGFLGIVPRRLIWLGEPVLAAVATNFAVPAESRGLAGVKLLAAFLAGRQDLSIADMAVRASRGLWEALGGRTSTLHSIRWLSVLSPGRAALHLLGRRRGFSTISALLSPAGYAIDALLQRIPKSPFRRPESRLVEGDLDLSSVLDHADSLLKTFPLRTIYDQASLAWMLRRAGNMNSKGVFQRVLLKSEQRKTAGWYLYYGNSGGIGEVLQIAAEDGAIGEVFDHLCAHAGALGVFGLTGRFQRGLLAPLSRRFSLFHRQPWWVLVHSRRAEILDAFQRGDVFFSRLEGEWCLRFQG